MIKRAILSLVAAVALVLGVSLPANAYTYRTCSAMGSNGSVYVGISTWLSGSTKVYHWSITPYREQEVWGPNKFWHERYINWTINGFTQWSSTASEGYLYLSNTSRSFTGHWYFTEWPGQKTYISCSLVA